MEKVTNEIIDVKKINTKYNTVDFGTKIVIADKFSLYRDLPRIDCS